ncbi:inositol monophosphatase [Enemella dayhoffiae]|uniref:Inositol-1-monophosphatase n=1 Tax=Enemella dayhoffiae TaxID=2016507 RepID=A0A255HB26_9ACTN|nr:inositol monophosphatase family protein [Enemella dayhoffiae]OYO25020.1 inositol monophosphatase [Enemella dayhoffiae]
MSDELRDLAVRLATTAAESAYRSRLEGVEVADLKSSPTDVVTAADRATEAYLRAELARLRPADGFFGEEEGRSDSGDRGSGLTWVVDPIDGTVNYLYQLPAWAVSVAVVEGPVGAGGHTLAGCVAAPAAHEVYAAAADQGATRNGQRLHLEPKHDLATALIGTGFSYSAERRTEQAELVARLIGQVRDIRRIGAASLDLCAVAAGRLDGYYESGLHPWDHAAGSLVVREAGGTVGGGPHGEHEDATFLLAANAGLYPPLSAAVGAAGA